MRRYSLCLQIVLWGLLPVLVLVITFSLTGVQSHRRSMRALIAQRNALLAQTPANEIAHQIAVYPRTLEALTEAWSEAGQEAVLPNTLLFPSGTVLHLTPDGRVTFFGSPLPPAEAEAWVQATAGRSPATVFGAVPALVWRQALPDGDALVVGMPVSALQLEEWLASSDISPYAALAIVTDDRVVYQVGNVTPEIAQLFTAWPPHTAYTVSSAPVASTPWRVVIVEPWEPLTAPFFHFNRWLPVVIAGAILFSSLALISGVHTLVRPLHALTQQAQAIGQGHFEAVETPVGGVREVEEVWHALRQMAGQIQEYQQALKQYIGRLTRSQEEERECLARELHDGIVQELIALDHRVQRIQRAFSSEGQLVEHLEALRLQIAHLITDLRRTCQALRPLYLEEVGLIPALEAVARDAGALFKVEGRPRRLPPEVELALYRIVQEALSNARRHAGATRVEVAVAFAPSAVHIRVRDNGKGFCVPANLGELTATGHFGLLSMAERAHLIGAHLAIESAPQAGTTVEVVLPTVGEKAARPVGTA